MSADLPPLPPAEQAPLLEVRNLSRGETTVLDSGLLWRAVLASNSPAGLLPPVLQGGELLVDGVLPSPGVLRFICQYDLPYIACKCDSYTAATRITRMTVKTEAAV